MMICGPFRCATGLLTASNPRSDPPGRLATFDRVEGQVSAYDPEPMAQGKPVTYHKRRFLASDFRELSLSMNAGEVIRLSGTACDGFQIEGAVAELELKVSLGDAHWVKHIESGKDGVVLVDDDAGTCRSALGGEAEEPTPKPQPTDSDRMDWLAGCTAGEWERINNVRLSEPRGNLRQIVDRFMEKSP